MKKGRRTLLVMYNGRQVTLKELQHEVKVPYQVLYNRLFNLNWSIEEAIETPYTGVIHPRHL